MLHYNMVHKPLPIPKAITIPEAKAALDQEWTKLQKQPACDESNVTSKAEVIGTGKSERKTFHFATLMEFCPELEKKFQNDEGRVVLRCDIVKHDSWNDAVFTEHGASASHMTAAKVLNVVSRLLSCSGQAPDAVSAYTDVKVKDAPTLLHLSDEGCPMICFRLPKAWRQLDWDLIDDPVVPLERNLYGHPLAGLLWNRNVGWACVCLHRKLPSFLSVYVNNIKMSRRTQNMPKMCGKLHNDQPTHGRSCSNVCWTLLRNGAQDDDILHKVSTPCLDDHHVKPEDLKIVGQLSGICSVIFYWNGCFWQALEDQIYFGQLITWPDQSQSGTEHAIFD